MLPLQIFCSTAIHAFLIGLHELLFLSEDVRPFRLVILELAKLRFDEPVHALLGIGTHLDLRDNLGVLIVDQIKDVTNFFVRHGNLFLFVIS